MELKRKVSLSGNTVNQIRLAKEKPVSFSPVFLCSESSMSGGKKQEKIKSARRAIATVAVPLGQTVRNGSLHFVRDFADFRL